MRRADAQQSNIQHRKSTIGFFLAIALPFLAGCAYERVDIFVGSEVYSGTILSHYKDVEATRSGLLLKPGARFAIKTTGMTQFLGQFDVAILAGQGMNVYLRAATNEFDTTEGIQFRYATDGSAIRQPDGVTIPLNYNAETDLQTLSFYNEASLVWIAAGCKRLYEEQTTLPGTEYLIFETLPNSTVELRAVTYFDTNME